MFTEFDIAVCIIITISALVSYLRGFTKDILGFVAWIGASVLTIALYPIVTDWFSGLFKSSAVINIISVIHDK